MFVMTMTTYNRYSTKLLLYVLEIINQSLRRTLNVSSVVAVPYNKKHNNNILSNTMQSFYQKKKQTNQTKQKNYYLY